MKAHAATDDARQRLEQQRDLVVQRLLPVIDAIDRKRHAVTDAVQHALPSRAAFARIPRRERVALLVAGAAAGGVAFLALGWARHRLAERRTPLRRIASGVVTLALARRRGSVLGAVARSVAGFAASAAAALARELLSQALAAHAESDRAIEVVLETPPPPERAPLAPPPLPALLAAPAPAASTAPGMPRPALRSEV